MKKRLAQLVVIILVLVLMTALVGCEKKKPVNELVNCEQNYPFFMGTMGDMAGQKKVEHTYKESQVTVDLPQDWRYEIEDNELRIWPEKATEGKLIIKHFDEPFGVCGTGLEEEKITLGGREAIKGIYWDDELWSFISFPTDEKNPYVILNQGAEKWDKAHIEQIMEILDTLKF